MEDTYILHCSDDEFILEPPLDYQTSSCLCLSQQPVEYKGSKGRVKKNKSGKNLEVKFDVQARSHALSHSSRKISVDAVLGTVCLLRGNYLVVVTRSKLIGTISIERGKTAGVRRIVSVDILPIPLKEKDGEEDEENDKFLPNLNPKEMKLEQTYLSMLQEVVETKALYYTTNGYDITNSLQRIYENKSKGQENVHNDLVDNRFVWNLGMISDFKLKGFSDWTQPIICGYVQVCNYVMVEDTCFTYVFISRRGIGRQGTRFIVRGLDKKGQAANFVETEQILIPDYSRSASNIGRGNVAAYSYVQTRGSIPVPWTQKVTLKYMPRVVASSDDADVSSRFRKHFLEGGEHSLDIYGSAVAVNLVDRVGKSRSIKDQRMLGMLYKRECDKLDADLDKQNVPKENRLRYVWFDFHHECRKMKWGNLSKLMKEVDTDIDAQDYFCLLTNGKVLKQQKGVMRTNCMDNLDRTNVVQSLFARKVALKQIHDFCLSKHEENGNGKNVLDSPYKDFEKMFKNVWANNADAMSVLYSGTPALKTDFTRTGKRTKIGLLKDGFNSVLRYYLNNFCDGKKQDAFDLFLGSFDVRNDTPVRSLTGKNSSTGAVWNFTLTLAFVYMLVFMLVTAVSAVYLTEDLWIWQKFSLAFWLSLLLCVVVLHRTLKAGLDPEVGRRFVQTPCLIPET